MIYGYRMFMINYIVFSFFLTIIILIVIFNSHKLSCRLYPRVLNCWWYLTYRAVCLSLSFDSESRAPRCCTLRGFDSAWIFRGFRQVMKICLRLSVWAWMHLCLRDYKARGLGIYVWTIIVWFKMTMSFNNQTSLTLTRRFYSCLLRHSLLLELLWI